MIKDGVREVKSGACPCCDGGIRRFYKDDPDPVEGHKMSSRMDCPFCKGVGTIADTDVRFVAVNAYWKVLGDETERREAERRRREQMELKNFYAGLAKLSFDEAQALGHGDAWTRLRVSTAKSMADVMSKEPTA